MFRTCCLAFFIYWLCITYMYLPLKEVCELPLGLAGELVREPGSCCTLWRTSRYVEAFITYVLMFFSLSIHNRHDACLKKVRISRIVIKGIVVALALIFF